VSDATPGSSPCVGGGTGALAFYVNGAWSCNAGLVSAGTVTNIITNFPLTGGPISTTGTIGCAACVQLGADLGGIQTAPTVINLSNVTNSSLANTGLVHPSLTVTAGTGLSGGGSVALGGTVTLNSTGTSLPSSPQIGDTVRYNVYGDTAWDVTSMSHGHLVQVSYSNGGLITVGNAQTANITATNTFNHINPTGSDGYGVQMLSIASASPNISIGADQGRSAATTEYGFGGFYRWALRWGAGNTTGVRYWLGLTQYNTGGSGTETTVPITGTSFATDTPNRTTLAFRFSSTTDTTWKATSQITAGSQTVVDTTIAIDTNNHTFEITYDNTTARYFIDGVLRASITTNVPNPTTYFYMDQFWSGDNKNAVGVITANMYWMTLALK